jgi:hypothetical protein
MKQLILLLLVSAMFVSCEKDIDFDLKYAEPVLVVDAQIENGQAPTVALSRSLSFFSKINIDILSGSFVRNAEVSMSNGTLTHVFKEYSVPVGNGYFIRYYCIDNDKAK